jgi:ketosteroid isomerase-like protein
MTTVATRSKDDAKIRELVNDWAESVRTRNADRAVSSYAPELTSFNVAPPLRARLTKNQYRDNLAAWFDSFDGPMSFEVRDLEVMVGDDVAFAHSVNRVGGKKKNGEKDDIWVRATIGFSRINGKWLVVHEHVSVPFYMDGSFKAAVDLKP